MASGAVIHFECRAEAHRALPSRRGAGGVTVHEKTWAYCDGDGSDDTHEWVATGGVPVEFLMRWSRPVTVVLDATAAPATLSATSAPAKIPPPSRKRSR